jgi:spore coat protein A, manganese oxidase
VPVGTELYLVNEGPEGRATGESCPPIADPHTTGQVLKFVIGPRVGTDPSVPPDHLRLPAFTPLPGATNTRRLSLHDSHGHGATAGEMLLGTIDAEGRSVTQRWDDPVTESPTVGSTEIWEVHNRTAHAHPIHLHGAQFQVVGRGPDGQQGPYAWESGYLDTAVVLPHEIARIRARFDRPGRFAWHCHILEHEDNGMMRPYQVVPRGAPETGGGATSEVDVPLAVMGVAALSVAAAVGSALARDGQADGD